MERPILFSGPMVRALLDGRKTQTRRVVKGVPLAWLDDSGFTPEFVASPENHLCPYGDPGDRLWVKETYQVEPSGLGPVRVIYNAGGDLSVDLTGDAQKIDQADRLMTEPDVCRPSIHMPRWASRLTLEITGVRIERLTDCSERDARAEGLQVKDAEWMPSYRGADDLPWRPEFPRDAYADLWNKINGEGSWDLDPWVWVVSFKVLPLANAERPA